MRLRKFVVKTQFIGSGVNIKRAHPERLLTEIVDPNISFLASPEKENQQKFLRFTDTEKKKENGSSIKKAEKMDKCGTKLQEKFFTIEETDREKKTVESHLQQILQQSSKPKRYHERLLTLPSSLPSTRKRREKSIEAPMQRMKYGKCCEVVDEIYSKIHLLKEIGYSDAKIDFWVLTFCHHRKPFMKLILMKNVNFSLYSLQEEFSYERSSQAVKNKIRYKVNKGKDLYGYLQLEQIQEFCHYMEDILIRKNNKKAREVEESITDKLSPAMAISIERDSLIFTKEDPKEVYNFVDELNTYQEKFGPFKSFSKINKLRFAELNRIQKSLKDAYKDLMEGEAKQIIRAIPSERHVQFISPQDN